MKKRYLFVDIDGVLTSMHEVPGSYINHDNDEYGISSSCLNRLIELAKKTDSKIIISSNWRKFSDNGIWSHQRGDFINQLPKLKAMLGNLYEENLPVCKHGRKTEALVQWFIINHYSLDSIKFVVFDDDIREGFGESEFKDNFILTNPEFGLQDKDIKKAEAILLS